MSSSIHNIVVDCRDPWQLAQFWSKVLARPVDPDNEPADDEVGIALDGNAGELLFLSVPNRRRSRTACTCACNRTGRATMKSRGSWARRHARR